MAALTVRQRTGWATANFVVIALALIPVLWLVSLSFKTRSANSCVVTVQTVPMIGNFTSTTGPTDLNLSMVAVGLRK